MQTKIKGKLVIDHERGVIYFYADKGEKPIGCVLKISNLPQPIPQVDERSLEIIHLAGTDWKGPVYLPPGSPEAKSRYEYDEKTQYGAGEHGQKSG